MINYYSYFYRDIQKHKKIIKNTSMGRIKVHLIVAVMLAVIIGLGSCRERKSSVQKYTDTDQRQVIEKQIEANVYPLPTSAEVVKLLTDLDVGYIIGISNPVDNAGRYVTSRSRAINMGIYGADLSYATLYNIQQEIIGYLNAIRVLANELNMSKIYDEKLYNEIKDNFDKKDELVNILTNAFNSSYTYLNDNDLQPLALLVVGGAWVEGMYITTNISESVYHVQGIVKVLLEQKESFELYLQICEPYAGEPGIKEMLTVLEPVRKLYEGLSSSLTEQEVNNITRVIAEVREKLII